MELPERVWEVALLQVRYRGSHPTGCGGCPRVVEDADPYIVLPKCFFGR